MQHMNGTPAARALEAHLLDDPGGRTVGRLFRPGELADSARTLAGATAILIATGFPQRGHPCGETDGPPGALVLARALQQLGKRVRILSEEALLPPLAAGAESLGLTGAELCACPWDAGGPAAAQLVAAWQPDCIIAVERPGRAADGQCYTMRGQPVADLVAPVEAVFRALQQAGRPTVAVGDGGNEIGMGKVAAAVRRYVPLGGRIAATCGCDGLVVAGNSNRGAYGLVAALSLHTGAPLLHGPAEEERLLASVAAAGAIDGVTGRCEASVDGVSSGVQAAWLEELHRLAMPG